MPQYDPCPFADVVIQKEDDCFQEASVNMSLRAKRSNLTVPSTYSQARGDCFVVRQRRTPRKDMKSVNS